VGWKYIDIETLIGKKIIELNIRESADEVLFGTDDGKKWIMHHNQDCCESVDLERVDGELSDLLYEIITDAECKTFSGYEDDGDWPKFLLKEPEWLESWTVSKLDFTTAKGLVSFIWQGRSNGYYGEEVQIEEVEV
jgi:hypothetical protein